MSWLKDGRGSQKFRHSRKQTYGTAQKRLDETLEPFRNQIEESLSIDSTEVVVYKRLKAGRPCSCQKVEVENDEPLAREDNMPITEDVAPQGSPHGNVGFDFYDDDPHGEGLAEASLESRETKSGSKAVELGDMSDKGHTPFDPADEVQRFEEGLYGGSNINCGLCYREGFQPPFEAVGYRNVTLTPYDMVSVQGFHVNRANHPATFDPVMDQAFVDFVVTVPKFFKNAKYSVRNNTAVLKGVVPVIVEGTDTVPLSLVSLNNYRGKEMIVRVSPGEEFTHVNFLFDEGTDPVLGSISEEADQLNYENDITVGNLTIVLPSRIGLVSSGDILVAPKRQLVLKVTDAPRKKTVDNRHWEWALQTRTLQRSEPLRYIHYGYKIF